MCDKMFVSYQRNQDMNSFMRCSLLLEIQMLYLYACINLTSFVFGFRRLINSIKPALQCNAALFIFAFSPDAARCIIKPAGSVGIVLAFGERENISL